VLPVGLDLNVSGGTLTGNQALTVDGAFLWTGGSITGSGLLTTTNTSTLNQPGGLTLSRNWVNAGLIDWQAGNVSLNFNASLTNTGNLNANAGAIMTLNSGSNFDNQGVFNLLSNISINNASNFVQSAGQLNLNDFVLTMAAGLQLNGGNLSGSGSIVGNVTNNGATLQPGGAAAIGTINITGDLINTSGVIEIEIQSVATPGITHDLIAVSGQTDLNDTLTLLPFGGYTVSDNDSVTPITSTISINNFSVINAIGIETVIPTYNAAGLDLLFTLGGVIGWDGEAADGNWFSVTNWIGDVLPTINDDVAIGVFNVTIAGAADANTLTLASGGSLTLTSGSLTIANDSTLTGDLIVAGGTLNLTNALTINSNLDWTSVANSTIDGGTTGSLIVNGTLNITGNNFHSFSGITVNNFGVTSYLATGGTTALRLNDGTTFNNNGLFDIQDNLLVGNLAGVAAFNNQAGGELRKSGGTAAATIVAGIAYTNSSASISIQSGSLTVNGGASLTLDSASVLEGSGTYIGDLVNNGTIRPGGALTTGTLSVNGVFTNTGAIEIEIDSIAGGPGVGYDELAIIGGNLANLGGNLDLISINGYRVLNGDALTPVSYGSRSGTFTVTAIGSEIISPTYNAGALDLVLNLGGLFSFTGGGDGSTWNDAANWNQGLPGIVNDVSIGNFNVTIADNASANTLSLASTGSLNLSGGTLTIASNSTLEGPVTMSGGDLDIGGATLTLNGGFNWTGPGFIFGGGSGILNLPAANIIAGAGSQGVDAVIVNISGNTTYSTGSLELYNGGGDPIINNSGIFDFTGDVSIANFTDGGSPGFNNLDGGTILKSAGTGTSTIDLMPGNSNQGNVTLQSGTLDIGLASWTLGVGDVFSGSGGRLHQ
jgi:autotransporter-associated beta strand protein